MLGKAASHFHQGQNLIVSSPLHRLLLLYQAVPLLFSANSWALWAPVQWTVQPPWEFSAHCHRDLLVARSQSPQHNSEVHPETSGYQTESFKPMGTKARIDTTPPQDSCGTLASEVMSVSVDKLVCLVGIFWFIFLFLQTVCGALTKAVPHQDGTRNVLTKILFLRNKNW